MNQADWLIAHRFEALVRRDFDWVIQFDGGASVRVECLWRLIENGRIRWTSLDDGHKFGLPAPVDVASEINARLAGASIERVDLHEGTLDLSIHLGTGHCFELLPNSAGYEAWELGRENQSIIAVGGGELAVFGDGPATDS